jgi:hypothetical protein
MAMGKDSRELLEAGQCLWMIQEIIRQIRERGLKPGHLQAFIEWSNPFIPEEKKEKPLTLDAIFEALDKNFKDISSFCNFGKELVITAEQAAKAWKQKVPNDVTIRYSEATLNFWLAQRNRPDLGGTELASNWRLVYINGLSLKQQFDILGKDAKPPLSFSKGCPTDDRKPIAGYYLINLYPTPIDFANQIIENFSNSYECCHPAVFAEALFSMYMVHNIMYAGGSFHQTFHDIDGSTRDINVGYFRNDLGLGVLEKNIVYSEPPMVDLLRYEMALCRKFDF